MSYSVNVCDRVNSSTNEWIGSSWKKESFVRVISVITTLWKILRIRSPSKDDQDLEFIFLKGIIGGYWFWTICRYSTTMDHILNFYYVL